MEEKKTRVSASTATDRPELTHISLTRKVGVRGQRLRCISSKRRPLAELVTLNVDSLQFKSIFSQHKQVSQLNNLL